MKKRIWLAAGVAVAAAGIARAEVLEITGEFAAPNREASLLHSISVDRMSGQDGPALGRAIEQGLSGTHFELLGGRTGRDTAEGSLSGGVTSGVDESSYTRREKKCTAKDANGKCTKEENVEVRCRKRVINVNVDLRMVRNSDGRIVYSASKPWRNESSWCGNDRPSATVEDLIAGAVRDIGYSVRGDIAPRVDTYRIRVRESDKGMSKDQGKRFKELVKLTKRDARAACAGWAAMRAELPNHPSLLFNLGLCAEQAGKYEEAQALYQDAARAGAREGEEGYGRVQQLIAGREDARERARRN